MKQTVTTTFAGKEITIETGRLAKQSRWLVLISCGNNIVLVTAVSSKSDSGLDFFSLLRLSIKSVSILQERFLVDILNVKVDQQMRQY